jgi:CRP-like cAMP-binding protein
MTITANNLVSPQDVPREKGNSVTTQPTQERLSPELVRALHGNRTVLRFTKGATLFQQGSVAAGIHILESGKIRMLLPTGQNQRQLLEVVGPGNMLGLSETMTGDRYRITAITDSEATAVFVPRDEFLEFLRQHCDFCMQVVRLLSEDLHGLYHKFRSISAHPGRPRQRPLDEQLN